MPSFSSDDWRDPLEQVNTVDAAAVAAVFGEAAEANFSASCRQGSIDVVAPAGVLIATGDLHDNPLHFARVLKLARLDAATAKAPRHVTLHEVIHGESPMGMDFSYRALLRVAAVKREFPESAHTLLANHELSQIVGAGIVKDGVRVVDAFNEGVEHVFGDDADRVIAAIGHFIRSMPLALVSRTEDGRGVLCAHSLPSPGMMEKFDATVLDRDLTEADYEPRVGAAHQMVWGRKQTAEQLAALAERWRVSLFLLGHQKAENGWEIMAPNAVILNSDHARGVALRIDLSDPPSPMDAVGSLTPLAALD